MKNPVNMLLYLKLQENIESKVNIVAMNTECEMCEKEQFMYDKFLQGLWDTQTLNNNIFILKKVGNENH